MFCAEAPKNIANAALQLYKTMPRGKLYHGVKLSKHKRCKDLGYKSSYGEDPCYPGLRTFYRNKKGGEQFYDILQNTLKEFGESNELTLDDTQMIESCKCEEKSYVRSNIMQLFNKSCDMAEELSVRNIQHVFVSSNKMFCAQASKSIAHDALNLFKSMPRGMLYEGSSLSTHKNCEDLGYTSSAGADPCYPKLQTFYRNKKEGEKFYKELQRTLKEFGEKKDMTLDDVNLMDSCKCKDKSYAKSNIGKLFNKTCGTEMELSSRNPPRTFISSNKMFCAEAPKNIAKDALNLYKSMPRGKLYEGSMLSNQKSCEDMGYKSSAGEDPCYPGLQTFYRNKEEGEKFYKELQNTLKKFGEKENLTLDDAYLMDSCKCMDKSFAKKNIGKLFSKSCVEASQLYSHSSPHTFISSNKLFCAQAPKKIANEALKLFKSMPRAKLYDGSVLSKHKSCEEMGYKSSAGEDPCYPGLETFYRNKTDGEQFYNFLQSTLKEFGESKNVTLDDANLMDSCKCKDKSYARKYRGNSCDKVQA